MKLALTLMTTVAVSALAGKLSASPCQPSTSSLPVAVLVQSADSTVSHLVNQASYVMKPQETVQFVYKVCASTLATAGHIGFKLSWGQTEINSQFFAGQALTLGQTFAPHEIQIGFAKYDETTGFLSPVVSSDKVVSTNDLVSYRQAYGDPKVVGYWYESTNPPIDLTVASQSALTVANDLNLVVSVKITENDLGESMLTSSTIQLRSWVPALNSGWLYLTN